MLEASQRKPKSLTLTKYNLLKSLWLEYTALLNDVSCHIWKKPQLFLEKNIK